MTSSLVGSEMCIRDSFATEHCDVCRCFIQARAGFATPSASVMRSPSHWGCLLYTSDAADDM
eukprot:10581174-Prorocentrum_lima.AAC.1